MEGMTLNLSEDKFEGYLPYASEGRDIIVFNNKKKNMELLSEESIWYTGLFVDDTEELKKLFPPKYKNELYHHSTFSYKPKKIDHELVIGRKRSLKIIGECYDKYCHTILVESEKSPFDCPHITLSVTEDVDPEYSNELIKKVQEGRKGVVYNIFENPPTILVTEGYCQLSGDIVK